MSATDIELSFSAAIIAGTIFFAREALNDRVPCIECRGTGAMNPDCRVCEGERYPRLKRLHALGWKNGDIEDIQEDGYALCPSSGCNGESCEFCQGDGSVPFFEQIQQERRALLFARYQQIVPLLTVDYSGRIRREHQLLSLEAAAPFIESGKATRLQVMAFGDEFYLRNDDDFPALWREARERARIAKENHTGGEQ